MRSEVWRPAAAARNRWPREVRDPARQALRPGCEELAARIRKANARRCMAAGAQGDGSAAPGAQNRHGGAPRGERPALCARLTGASPSTRTTLGAPPTLIRGERANMQNPGAETRGGNEMGCLTW